MQVHEYWVSPMMREVSFVFVRDGFKTPVSQRDELYNIFVENLDVAHVKNTFPSVYDCFVGITKRAIIDELNDHLDCLEDITDNYNNVVVKVSAHDVFKVIYQRLLRCF